MIEIELFPQIDETLTDISLVKYPANESIWLTFAKQNKPIYHFSSDERMVLTGAVLIPEQRIYRRDGNDEYYVYFSADTIRTISEQFLTHFKNQSFTLEHGDNTNDVSIVESWIVEDSENDKSNALGLNLPKGSWVISAKVNSPDLWQRIKVDKEFEGFSVAGMFCVNKLAEEEVIEEAERVVNEYDKQLTK